MGRDDNSTNFSTNHSVMNRTNQHDGSTFQSAARPLHRKSMARTNVNNSMRGGGGGLMLNNQSGAFTPVRSNIRPQSNLVGSAFKPGTLSSSTPRVPGFGGGSANKENMDRSMSIFRAMSFNQSLNASRNSGAGRGRKDFDVKNVPTKSELKDPDVQQDQVAQILNFIKMNNYDKDHAVKDICPPSNANIYYNIWEFLVKIVDPSFTWEREQLKKDPKDNVRKSMAPAGKGPNRIRKDLVVIDYVKELDYPHVIPGKSSFTTINQKTSWLPLLSILIYHKQIAEFSVSNRPALLDEISQTEHMSKIQCMREIWEDFLGGDSANKAHIHEEYERHQLQSVTERMGTYDELEEKYDGLQGGLKELNVDRANLKQTNEGYQRLQSEVESLKVQEKMHQADLSDKLASLESVKSMQPKREIERIDQKIFEANEQLVLQGEPKSKLKAKLEVQNKKIEQARRQIHERECEVEYAKEENTRVGKVLNERLEGLTNDKYVAELSDDSWDSLEELLQLLNTEKQKIETRVTDLDRQVLETEEAKKKLRERCTMSKRELTNNQNNLEYWRELADQKKKKKQLDTEARYQQLCDKEKRIYRELDLKREELANLSRTVDSMEERVHHMMANVRQGHKELSAKEAKMAEAAIKFMCDVRDDIEGLRGKMNESHEAFVNTFKTKFGIDLKLPVALFEDQLPTGEDDSTTHFMSTPHPKKGVDFSPD